MRWRTNHLAPVIRHCARLTAIGGIGNNKPELVGTSGQGFHRGDTASAASAAFLLTVGQLSCAVSAGTISVAEASRIIEQARTLNRDDTRAASRTADLLTSAADFIAIAVAEREAAETMRLKALPRS
jgi:hypothetical protein